MFDTSPGVLVSDAARSENRPEDNTVYTGLGSAANMTLKFRINPVTNYTVHWSMGDSGLEVRNAVKGEHVQSTYFVSHVTNKTLGNYTIQVTNWPMREHNIVTFYMVLKLRGKVNELVLCT